MWVSFHWVLGLWIRCDTHTVLVTGRGRKLQGAAGRSTAHLWMAALWSGEASAGIIFPSLSKPLKQRSQWCETSPVCHHPAFWIYRDTKVLDPERNPWSEGLRLAGDSLPLTRPARTIFALHCQAATSHLVLRCQAVSLHLFAQTTWQAEDPTRWQDSLSPCSFYPNQFRASALGSQWAQPHWSVLCGPWGTHTHQWAGGLCSVSTANITCAKLLDKSMQKYLFNSFSWALSHIEHQQTE